MNMLEKVARALCPLDPDGNAERVDGNRWYRPGIPYWQSWVGEARATIEAMRDHEPNMDMLIAAKEAVKDWSEFGVEWLEEDGEAWKRAWRALHDAALADEKPDAPNRT